MLALTVREPHDTLSTVIRNTRRSWLDYRQHSCTAIRIRGIYALQHLNAKSNDSPPRGADARHARRGPVTAVPKRKRGKQLITAVAPLAAQHRSL